MLAFLEGYVRSRRIASADSSVLLRKPTAGLSAMSSTQSSSSRDEIRITLLACGVICRPTSKPLSALSEMSTRATSRRSSRACLSAFGAVGGDAYYGHALPLQHAGGYLAE
jgi:hypothetical protein